MPPPNPPPSHASAAGQVGQLIQRGAHPDSRDARGRRPAHLAAAHGHAGVLRMLLSAGADADAEDVDGRTPLHFAAAQGHADIIAQLALRGAWVDANDAADDGPLHLAARCAPLPAPLLRRCRARASPARPLRTP